MKRYLFVLASLLLLAAPLSAHHSTAMNEMANPTTISGTVKRFEWTNPHAFIYLDVKDDKGASVEWEIELMSLNHLRSYGWVRTTVKPGDQITVITHPLRDGRNGGSLVSVKLADGTRIGGSPTNDPPPQN